MIHHRLSFLAGLVLLLSSACSWVPRPLITHDPLTSEEHLALGQAYLAKALYPLAKEEFLKSLARDPQNLSAHMELGNLAYEAGAFEEAGEHFQAVLKMDTGHAGASNNLAMVYLAQGSHRNEIESLARRASDGSAVLRPYALHTLATLYLEQGRHEEAAQTLEEADRLAAGGPSNLRMQLAQLRRRLDAQDVPCHPVCVSGPYR
ncbi:MAG TPA: tetratricopeptide repeat protein [Nitrospiraceae bacterium]|nr:tetratricopeptide repeat protein [Nitrospiraceae bacterium]